MAVQLSQQIDRLPKVSGSSIQYYLSNDLERALTEAEKQAERMGDEYVSVEHIVLGILNKPDSTVKDLMRQWNINEDNFLNAVREVRGNQRVTSDNPEAPMMRLKIRTGFGGACPQPEA